MILYNTRKGIFVESDEHFVGLADARWDELVNRDDLHDRLADQLQNNEGKSQRPFAESDLLPPIGSQEVWAAGVTYLRSRTARMEEAETAGGGSFYDKIYQAERPELFFKATAHRVVGHRRPLRLRRDSNWIVPEPELTLLVSSRGRVVGYTCGNDLSCRDIEGENPLYLPQAKVFNRCAALGPGLRVVRELPAPETTIRLVIHRASGEVFSGATALSQMKQPLMNLVAFLMRENSFPVGAFLMTGTGIVPPNDFSLRPGDETQVSIDGVGTLINPLD